MSTLYRAQLLLESEQHQALAEIAEREGRSISDLVREIVGLHLAERNQQAENLSALRALERMIQIDEARSTGFLQSAPLAEVRADSEADARRMWRNEP